MATRRPDERQLHAAAYRVAKVYLEIERGLRSPDHLKKILAPKEYQRHRSEPMETRHPGVGPVVPDDVGRIHIDRNIPGQVTASVNTRETGDRWGAVTIHFRERRDGWVIDHLERLHRRGLAEEQKATTVEPNDLGHRITSLKDELGLVVAARRTSEQRLHDLPDASLLTSSELADKRQLQDQLDRWKQRENELHSELEVVRERAGIHARLGSLLGIDPQVAEGTIARDPVGERLIGVLGPMPHDSDSKHVWLAAYEHVVDYRETWNVEDERTLLGEVPDYEGQQRHREQVIEHLESAARTIRHQQPEREATFERSELRQGPTFGLEL